jgi:hypothetical protein
LTCDLIGRLRRWMSGLRGTATTRTGNDTGANAMDTENQDEESTDPEVTVEYDSLIDEMGTFLSAFLPCVADGVVSDGEWSDRVKFARDKAAIAAFERFSRICQSDLEESTTCE